MSFRELINQHKGLAIAAVGVVVLLSIVWLTWSGGSGSRVAGPRAFYSDDDGKTFFVDAAGKVTPFEHDGKQAVKAHVFACGGDRSVHYLERHADPGRKAPAGASPEEAGAAPVEFKRPGETAWQPNPPGPNRCPDGSQAEWVTPD